MSAPTPPAPPPPSPTPPARTPPRIAEPGAAGRPPGSKREARLPAAPDQARRAELAAALGVLCLLAHLLLAQVTLILTVLALITGRVSRWRPLWLAVPAAAGLAWTAQIGAGRAVAGFLAGPRRILDDLTGAAGHPARLGRVPGALSGAGHWLPGQLPVALVLAAGEAAAIGWLGRGGWLGGRDEPAEYRPGLLVALRRRRTVADLAAGEVVTRAGCGLGLDTATGRPAELSWARAEGGVLVTGPGHRATALAAFPLACAAARRHKTLIVLDLAGRAWPAGALADACAAAGLGLARLDPDQPDLVTRLALAVAERSAVLLVAGAEGHRPGSGQAARQALYGLTAALGDLREQGLRGDGLAWVHGATMADQPGLAGLPALGAATGLAVALSTADESAAVALAEAVRVVVVAGPAGQSLEAMLRGETLLIESSPAAVSGLRWQGEGEFTIFYLNAGRVVAGLSVSRSGDLEHARRLIKSGADLGERAAALGDPSTDLGSL